jgi:hypothetical protein
MSRAKLIGDPCNPIGATHQWKLVAFPGTEKAAYCLDSSSNSICQKPEVKSMQEYLSESDLPISSIHSLT